MQICTANITRFSNTSLTGDKRLYRNDFVSDCSVNKTFPGLVSVQGSLFEISGPHRGLGFPTDCVTINVNPLTCAENAEVHIAVYNQTPDVTDLKSGYLGDQGSSSGNEDFESFSISYADNVPIYILAQSNFGPTTCEFEYSIAWATCPSATIDITNRRLESSPTGFTDEDVPPEF